jgi:hypothetical protein
MRVSTRTNSSRNPRMTLSVPWPASRNTSTTQGAGRRLHPRSPQRSLSEGGLGTQILLKMIEHDGPLLYHAGEDQQGSFESTCRKFRRFLIETARSRLESPTDSSDEALFFRQCGEAVGERPSTVGGISAAPPQPQYACRQCFGAFPQDSGA